MEEVTLRKKKIIGEMINVGKYNTNVIIFHFFADSVVINQSPKFKNKQIMIFLTFANG